MVSFGFKYGSPVDADLLFDVRFLKNPYFVMELRDKTGLDEAVRDYVLEQGEARELSERVLEVLSYCLPRFEREGRSYVTIGYRLHGWAPSLGCVG